MGCSCCSLVDSPASGLLARYTLGAILGQGAFGIVYKCARRGDGREFAVKMIDQVEMPLTDIYREVRMLRTLAHPSVVRVHEVFHEKVFVCVVLDLLQSDLIKGMKAHWNTKGDIPTPVVKRTGKKMMQAIEWLHRNHVVHGDIKPDNFLQDKSDMADPDCRVVLGDFGTAVECAPGSRLRVRRGTRTYWAPECYDGDFAHKVDVFAFGVTVIGMLNRRFPFKGEVETKMKVPSIPDSVGEDGKTFISGILSKKEESRLSAAKALAQAFLAQLEVDGWALQKDKSVRTSPSEVELSEQGPNAAVRERRLELVERLENQHAMCSIRSRTSTPSRWSLQPMRTSRVAVTSSRSTRVFVVPVATMTSCRFEDSTERPVKIEWWPSSRASAVGLYDAPDAKTLHREEIAKFSAVREEALAQMLAEHGVPVQQFGEGDAKTLGELAREVENGVSRLMLDAAQHKTVVRVVDIVLLRLVCGKGSSKRYLVMTLEQSPGVRRRDSFVLPGMKRKPHENGKQAVHRLLRERLNISEDGISCDFAVREIVEEDQISPSYPGLRTVYRKEYYEAIIDDTDAQLRELLGLPGKSRGSRQTKMYTHTDPECCTRLFEWMTEAQCNTKRIRLRAPAEWQEISALVPPPVGMGTEELANFLATHGIDLAQFGRGGVVALAYLSEELVQGLATLERRSEEGQLARVVDTVSLKVARPDGNVLVEVEMGYGGAGDLASLPGVSRRAHENLFAAARRGVGRILKVHENAIDVDPDNVQLVEEEMHLAAYGTLSTIHRRHIISVTVIDDVECV